MSDTATGRMAEYEAAKERVVAGLIEMLQAADRAGVSPVAVQGEFLAAFVAAAESTVSS